MQQANDIYSIFNEKMNNMEKQAFLLGRISILLEVGNNFSDNINKLIEESDNLYRQVQEAIKTSVKENNSGLANDDIRSDKEE